MTWQVPRIWEGGDVWIIGGGPSLTKVFGIPDDVVQRVINGHSPAIYSSYMASIHEEHVIGVNAAYLIGDWIDMVFFGDGGFFLTHQLGLSKFPGLKVACNAKAHNVPWVKYLPRDEKHPKGITNNPKKVSWNKNSGAAAISVAAHAGAKRIILLGFDMKLGVDSMQHWHDVYKRRGAKNRKGGKLSMPFGRHLKGFPYIAADAKKMGIEVLNANPDSNITCFPKFTIKELLHDNS